MNKITQKEAERFLNMLKRSLVNEINFPDMGKSDEFCVQGDTKKDLFLIYIFRGKIKNTKYNIIARISKNNILLLELHINPSNVHINPDGEKIIGSHWHIYTEEYGRRLAVPAENINSKDFVENTIAFLRKFKVIDLPKIQYQFEIL